MSEVTTVPATASAAPAPDVRPAARSEPVALFLRTPVALVLVFVLALAFRLVALPGSTPENMDPDAAHFLNVARCFERGQGFSNVGAWPAWMQPEKLPMPETFKEPGYPWLIWKLKPITGGDPFRAGQLVSMVGGLAIPLLLYALARMLTRDRTIALGSGLIAAASPLLIEQSVRVMVDSIFPAAALAAMTLAAWRAERAESHVRASVLDVATGLAFGAAFLLRGGALILWLPLTILAFRRRSPRAALGGLALTGLAAVAIAWPFLARNFRLFHTWYHSDVGAYGIWPYYDHLKFNAGLDRPPAPIGFALHHLPEVAKHWVESFLRFFVIHTLPEEILGHQWIVPAAVGVAASLRRWREHLFIYCFVAATTSVVFAVNWDARYFVLPAAFWCLFAATGAVELLRRLGPVPGRAGLDLLPILIAVLLLSLPLEAAVARHLVRSSGWDENAAAKVLGPELNRRLGPDESVMVMTTSTYAWYADRPTVHLVISDRARFLATLRRLKVRLAVLPTARLDEFASRYEGGRLPDALRFERTEQALGVTVFRVDPDAAPGSGPR